MNKLSLYEEKPLASNTCSDNRLRQDTELERAESAFFCRIDEMQAVCESEGWTISYNQISAGKLSASTVSRDYHDLSLLDEAADRCLELIGTTPVGCVTVITPCTGMQLWVNGRKVRSDHIILLDSDTEMHCMTGENGRVLSMHIPIPTFEKVAHGIREDCLNRIPDHVIIIEADDAAGRRLRQLMRKAIYDPIQYRWQTERTSELVTQLIRIASPTIDCFDVNYGALKPRYSLRTVVAARDYIESHLDGPISMAKICTHVGVSLSKLERTFRKELELTPSDYIRARRLAAAQRELIQASPNDKQVAEVALNNGFCHLGRFAASYRRQFGELPSETLRGG